uniref:Uncharacterized protein n=1 Tax=Human betaherpesvirus 6 TaxID=10368 RepID=A0A5P9S5N1_9BETA|nr:hypothetical protein [Human betaherpesvirus 6]QFV47777.1 hypothetical protein [Human betaherpesvirus 6]QFV49783.1 hypothetical protein [Human betaherpesvirus 6]QFW95488.1 hypothetical protein [Human betaherpesvirus 6]QFX17960.1 hypothetical protein [Human betaherpesvirus 6]
MCVGLAISYFILVVVRFSGKECHNALTMAGSMSLCITGKSEKN